MRAQSSFKFFLSLGIVVLAMMYALPNFFSEKLAVEVRLQEPGQITVIQDWLQSQKISCQHEQNDETAWFYFSNSDAQIQAKNVIEKQFPKTQASLVLKRDLPNWLTSIGARPMKLGLDLRGGVHLLLALDTHAIESQWKDQTIAAFKRVISEQEPAVKVSAEKEEMTLEHPASSIEKLRAIWKNFGFKELDSTPQKTTLTLVLNETAIQPLVDGAVDQTVKSLEKRINELGIAEATIARQGSHFIAVDLPGIQDIARAKALLGKTATLRFHLLADLKTSNDTKIQPISGQNNSGQVFVETPAVLSGDSIIFARAQRDDQSGMVVHIGIDPLKEKDFYTVTESNRGRRMAVVYSEHQGDKLEEYVISAPVIQSGLGSQFQITGMQSAQAAKDLAVLLRSGALAAPIKIVEEATIGPSLGEDNIQKGFLSLLTASMTVFIFMGYYYRAYGWMANIGLFVNILLIVAALSLLDATLTLPGIAGIVLTVGMAVDANVLINERIREELRMGESLKRSIALGYRRAFDTIFDSNMSTLLVAVLLFGLGSSSIKGFAVTLTIGILASLFTSVSLTRLLLESYAGTRLKLASGADWFQSISYIRFMAIKNKAFVLSAALILASAAAISIQGLRLGLDFTGGVEFRIHAEKVLPPENLRVLLADRGWKDATVQSIGTLQDFMIRVPHASEALDDMQKHFKSDFPDLTMTQIQVVGPQWGSELLQLAAWSVCFSLLGCALYIAFRFEWRLALAALFSLLHDPIIILGMLAAFQMEFNLITLAALLTVMGYSLNDTIVIYDRLRENFQKRKDLSAEEVVELSTNQTLSRTILTSGLTSLVVLCLIFFGGASLAPFSYSLLTGIAVGTYSSIYVAGALAVDLGLKRSHLLKKRTQRVITTV